MAASARAIGDGQTHEVGLAATLATKEPLVQIALAPPVGRGIDGQAERRVPGLLDAVDQRLHPLPIAANVDLEYERPLRAGADLLHAGRGERADEGHRPHLVSRPRTG